MDYLNAPHLPEAWSNENIDFLDGYISPDTEEEDKDIDIPVDDVRYCKYISNTFLIYYS